MSARASAAPAAVGSVTLRVHKIGARTADGTASPLGGATFFAIPATVGDQPGVDETSEYSCVTTPDGTCDILVPPLTGGTGTSTAGYWIVEGSAPDGWNRLTAIATGHFSDPKTASPYMAFTGPVLSGVIDVTEDTIAFRSASALTPTPTTEQNAVVDQRANSALPSSCGLDVALMLDLSNSMDADRMAQLKDAASAFVGDEGLGGTPSEVAMYTFQTNAQKLLDSTSIQTPAGVGAVTEVIEALPADGSGQTNWDDAFRHVAFDPENYDLALILSDGDPTTWGTDGDANVDTTVSFRNVEEAVLSANALKERVGPSGDRTKIVAVGIEPTQNSALNLAAVSGPVLGEDYHLTDFAGLAAQLKAIASENCGGTLTVVKQLVDAEGDIVDEGAEGWAFTGTTDGPSIVGPDGTTDELSLSTGEAGSVNFELAFDDGSGPIPVTVTEEQQQGWTPYDVNCTDGATPTGDAASFTVDVPAGVGVTCYVQNQSTGGGGDVAIEKAAVIAGVPVDAPLESGAFDYALTVTNTADTVATNVVVTDPVPGRFAVTGIALPADSSEPWTNDFAPALVGPENTVSVRTSSLEPGESVEIVLSVEVSTVAPPEVPNLGPNDPAPPIPELPQSIYENVACVDAAVDDDPTNDCASVEVELKDLTAIVYTQCIGDAPLMGFVYAMTPNLAGEGLDLSWAPLAIDPDTEPKEVSGDSPYTGLTGGDLLRWPGSAFTPTGVSIDYPGWRPLVAADYAPAGGYYLPGTTTVMTPTEQSLYVFNGLIADPEEADAAWRFTPGTYDDATTRVTLSVNPEVVVDVSYPQATPECFVPRHTEVQVEKSASVARTGPGGSFDYTIDIGNVSDDAAAEGIVLTDPIPSSIKITDVSWVGIDDPQTFPTWEDCSVSGQDAQGYGGELTCTLFGPLQPSGAEGVSAAPTVTLAATVSPSATAATVTNTAVVDYYTFGDPGDTGRDTDDATVGLATLPPTGPASVLPIAVFGVLAMAGGLVAALVRRRRGSRAVL